MEALFDSERCYDLTYLGYVLAFLKRRTRLPTGADVEIQFKGQLRKFLESWVQTSSSHRPRVVSGRDPGALCSCYDYQGSRFLHT
jgi:hypothetical protein